MPSGNVHARCSLILAVPAFAVAFGAGNGQAAATQLTGALCCAAGSIAGIALTPDLDQETLSSSEHALIKWTLGLGFLWTMLWYPYARVVKHRSPFSHWPLLGTAIRLLYMGVFAAIAIAAGWQPPIVPLEWPAWAVAGLALSDAAHWLLDTFT